MNFGESLDNSSIMKRFSVLLIFILVAVSAVAQTDTNAVAVPPDTNAPAPQPDTNGVAVYADTNTTTMPTNRMAAATTHPMSLEDCIQEALQHNFDMQISRYTPQIQLFNVRADYGGYDPTFSFSGQDQHNDTGGEFINGLPRPAQTSDQGIFNSGLTGLLPWGLTYNFSGNVNNTHNVSFENFTNTATQNSSGSAGVSLTQPLLKNFWIDSTRLTIKLAKNQLASDEQGLRLQIITSVTAVENAYYELIYAQENVKVQQ